MIREFFGNIEVGPLSGPNIINILVFPGFGGLGGPGGPRKPSKRPSASPKDVWPLRGPSGAPPGHLRSARWSEVVADSNATDARPC